MPRKYELTDETVTHSGRTLYRIRAVRSFGDVEAGEMGGFIEGEKNLDQAGNAWVFGNAVVSGNAKVFGNAWVSGNAWVCGNAKVYGNAWVCGNAKVYGNARVYGNAWVCGNAKVYGNAWVYGDAVVTSPIIAATRSDGYTFVCTPTKDGPPVIIAGCRYFTFDEAREHWTRTRGGTRLGDESLALVDHLERMARIAGWIDADAATQAA